MTPVLGWIDERLPYETEEERHEAHNAFAQAHTDHLASDGIDGIEYHALHGTTFAGLPDAVVIGTPTHRYVEKFSGARWTETLEDDYVND